MAEETGSDFSLRWSWLMSAMWFPPARYFRANYLEYSAIR